MQDSPTDAPEWLTGGEMGKLIRSLDWSRSPLGPIASWPQSLRTTVSLCLASTFPISIAWGPKHVQIYNDGYWPICGGKHPHSLGQDFSACWASAWPVIGEAFARALAGEASYLENQRMFLDRNGYLEETFFTFSFSPIRDETGGVGGLFHPVTETTARMVSERRTRALRDLAGRAGNATTVREACALAAQTLAEYHFDLPFVLLYLLDNGAGAQLAGSAHLPPGLPASPAVVDLAGEGMTPWPLAQAIRSGVPILVEDLEGRLGPLACGPYPEAPQAAFAIPILGGAGGPTGVLVAGVSPRLPLNEQYRSFYDLLGAGVGAAVSSARAYEVEKKRAEALTELDRAKTAFFSNVSHEFRTPLTLMLGPLEEVLHRPGETLPPGDRAELEVVHRSGLRLLKLVNTLLDFARLEAGRSQAVYEAVDLAALTAELASVFRSAIEKAGLRLAVDCPALPEPVYVDREMWEKVVLNLLSNAFKFTFEGEIAVVLRGAGDRVELDIRDTGTGIPPEELPHIFERFHRARGTRSRTHEGSGIGLALVLELVHLHGGTVTAISEVGRGTTFTVRIPTGTRHLPADRIGAARPLASTAVRAEAFVEEALRWLPEEAVARHATPAGRFPHPDVSPPRGREHAAAAPARVLLADDNADMRDYLRRLLCEQYEVDAVADGQAALAAARQHRPDLVLSDVMMPNLDGFGLLKALRADPATRTVPMILLSARAGEESRVEGLEAGADDYLIKPFSAREVQARVEVNLRLARLRQEVEHAAGREEALKEANRRKDEFLAMLAHELRNPLAPIRNALHILEHCGEDRAILSQVREMMDRQIRHLGRLVDDLLDVSRITRGKIALRPERLDLARLVRLRAQDHESALTGAGLALRLELPETPIWVVGDPTRLRQILDNLLENALKFTDRGGLVSVGLSTDAEEQQAVLTVRDTGVGMEPTMLPSIFDIFAQADRSLDRSRGGLGLGLALVKGLVALHGGRVEAASEGPGCGTTLTLWLPQERELPALAETAGRHVAPAQRLRVLVVEDNLDAAESLRMLLELFGYVVTVAHSGPEGVAAAQRAHPDVVLCDIGLPGMDGFAVAGALRLDPATASARLIAVTGYGQDEDRRRALAAGFDEHLVKPVDPEVLLGQLVPSPN